MRDLWLIQRANALLIEGLESLGVVRGYPGQELDDQRWWSATAPRAGLITDVDLQGLKSLLTGLPAAGGEAATGADRNAPALTTDDHGAARIQVLRFCGDSVERGERLIVLRRDAFALTADPFLPLDGVLKIESDES